MIRIRLTPLTAPLAAAALLALGACSKPADQQAASEPTAPSSDWVAENPTEPAVPVDLPKTEMTTTVTPAASASRPAATGTPPAR